MKHYKLNNKASMKRFEKDLLNEAIKAAQNSTEFDIECPDCNKTFKAYNGLNTCPYCGKQVQLDVEVELTH